MSDQATTSLLDELREIDARSVMQTYKRLPVEFVRGEGAHLYDGAGEQYLDFLAGISVCNAGHCHPHVVEAIRAQAARLTHASNLYYTEPGTRLAARLAATFAPDSRVFLCNSGAEANEGAIKLARRRRTGGEIVVLAGAFHGRTMGALAATPQEDKQAPFAPLVPGFVTVPRDDPERLAAAVGDSTAGVMIEPIQGETGIWPISDEMLTAARSACDRAGALLIFDEIQTGMGRTGTLWAHEQTPVRPDVMTVAKSLGSGLPIGAVLAAGDAAEVLRPGDHGTTFGGGPVVAAAAHATLDVIADESQLAHVREMGKRLRAGLEGLRSSGRLTDVRGRGLMIGADVVPERAGGAPAVVEEALGSRLVLNATGPETLRFLPPFAIGEADVDRVLAFLSEAL
jgi:predicted acetylornithine/succinylornithine family transaminase